MVCFRFTVVNDSFDPCCISLGQLIKILREPQMVMVVDKLIEFSSGKDEELRDISGLGIFPVLRNTLYG